jgi:hypothetical protein
MKNNQVNKNSKSVLLPPIRAGAETEAKLTAMSIKAGKSKSAVIRELIDNGEVKTIFGGKELMRDVANIHKKFNQYSLKMSNEIQSVKNDIDQIKLYMQNCGVRSEILHVYLVKASLRLDDLQERYNEQMTICTRVLPKGKW